MHPGNWVNLFGDVLCEIENGEQGQTAKCTSETQIQGTITLPRVNNKYPHWHLETEANTLTVACSNSENVAWSDEDQQFRCDKNPHIQSPINIKQKTEPAKKILISQGGGDDNGYNMDYWVTSDFPKTMRSVIVHGSKEDVTCKLVNWSDDKNKISCTLAPDAWIDTCASFMVHDLAHKCVALKNETKQEQTITHTCQDGVWAFEVPQINPRTFQRPCTGDAYPGQACGELWPSINHINEHELYCVPNGAGCGGTDGCFDSATENQRPEKV
jgi:hypothetical protein